MTALLDRIAALSPEKRRLLVERLDPLAMVQEPIWFLHRFATGVPAYNIPMALAVSGPLDCAVLERTMRTIVARHEILRTTFPSIDGQPVQLVAPDAQVSLPMVDLGAVAVPPNSPDEFAKFIAENIDKWTKVIKFAGIKPE